MASKAPSYICRIAWHAPRAGATSVSAKGTPCHARNVTQCHSWDLARHMTHWAPAAGSWRHWQAAALTSVKHSCLPGLHHTPSRRSCASSQPWSSQGWTPAKQRHTACVRGLELTSQVRPVLSPLVFALVYQSARHHCSGSQHKNPAPEWDSCLEAFQALEVLPHWLSSQPRTPRTGRMVGSADQAGLWQGASHTQSQPAGGVCHMQPQQQRMA